MEKITLNCYKDFKCIGSACSDNCCVGWEIDIDEKTNAYYKTVAGGFGKKLSESIQYEDGQASFIMKDRRCPFLNKDNLCDIIINLGEDKLCEICTEHPRFYEWFGDKAEQGIGLCCEEGARLLLEFDGHIKLESTIIETNNMPKGEDCDYDEDFYNDLNTARNVMFDILQNPELKFNERAGILLIFACDLQDNIDDNLPLSDVTANYKNQDYLKSICDELYEILENTEDKDALLTDALSVYQDLEPFLNMWPDYIGAVQKNVAYINKSEKLFLDSYKNAEKDYEKIVYYFIYRYMMKSIFDKDVLSRVKFAIFAYITIKEMDLFEFVNANNDFSMRDQIKILTTYSKEIEYCSFNMSDITDELYIENGYNAENLVKTMF